MEIDITGAETFLDIWLFSLIPVFPKFFFLYYETGT